ncbi:thiol reductant ABC exporter subunit CydD [Actinomycetaceae bacterium WB03_NA08]|uniref:Thiol reductant ABC exporter subunit CydD n=1 Tax=Scrofimicrobium canadense TaxID=2652290 RepID=A0A6N7VPK6_9ACTO|nr:thiol reductant ABC exporter subunit CydD [Scrofimicrobium canadense]MSS83669.1 thiol reductant ABC exporter subunit CydD [Scrofimicrobium canadense]
MRPLDPRLLRYAKAARRYIVEIAILGILVSFLVIAGAFLIAASVSPVVNYGAELSQIAPLLGWLAAVFVARALLLYWRESRAHKAADQTIATLREQVVAKTARLGPRWRSRNGVDTTTLVTRGLDDLDPYFVRYLPQLVMMMTVTPATLVTIFILDPLSAIIAAVTVPLIPVFMILIGKMTESASRKRLLAMEQLGSQLLDLLVGLPTLKALGREKGPRRHLEQISEQSTKTTMQTLRIAFLSGGVLEFLATLSVALVAVSVGFRMVTGDLDLFTGLTIIMLAPEVYEPLRQVGAQFHASANGIAAAEECFSILEQPETPRGDLTAPTAPIIHLQSLSVAARGAWAPDNLSATIPRGKITALAGASGVGKTTTAMTILGLETPTRGSVLLDSQDLADTRMQTWWSQVSWVPQSPLIVAGSVTENIGNDANPSDRDKAAEITGFAAVVETLPGGWDTLIGAGGIGLSVGQRQRLALTKALLQRSPYVILDEPTAHLDAMSEEQIVHVLEMLRDGGTTIIVIAHRQAVLDSADLVIPIPTRPATQDELEAYPQLSVNEAPEDLSDDRLDLLDSRLLEENS